MSESKNPKVTRRGFMHGAGALAAAAFVGSSSKPSVGQVRGANDRIGVGFIGCGGRSGAHFRAVRWLKTQGNEAVEIVAACDVYRPRLAQRVEDFGGKAYMDHRELLADPNVDVVCIATPDHVHGYQAIDAIKAGKDVYCEKPVTHWRQFELTKRLAEEVRKSGRVFQLGSQGMRDSAWHQMRKLIEDGLIGKPIHAECGYFRVGDWGERGMPIDDPNARSGADLNWDAFLGDAPKKPFDVSRFFRWRMYEDYAGGPSTDLFPHSLTPVIHMLGVTMPSTVVATGGKFRYDEREIPDTFNILIDYPEAITVAVLGTQGNDYTGTGFRGAPGRIPIVRGWEGTLTIQGNDIVFTPAQESKKQPQRVPIDHGEDFVEYWRDFLTCCRSRTTKTASPMDLAYHVQTALQMAMLAWKEGKVARFDPAREQIVL
ncbi:MAG: Gfo/Idh/MocA family oxidoreductase [Sedimentisphaerales bacterium]|nr:Gfo/Idh/MocA family oxidoreductase [Sedimentisphaerales bacterium]HNY76659.1 Gfo/Idh/MocA family oxidoreductase [Sedimentisphaerales bacterium]HOC61734.1 Gfo/Idh/MocA family oxidoreductase [Sedimentisphaerales bacterium]HOH62566.1 Gfo/Idh/MocA family oxidoreductase [Sedimentisphaerales bacterium]HPY48908.1 Gfo/Idh/MocA family oxidoreductase [Sedimentisphaerales bacterium]